MREEPLALTTCREIFWRAQSATIANTTEFVRTFGLGGRAQHSASAKETLCFNFGCLRRENPKFARD